MVQKILAWTCLGCTVVFAGVAAAAVFAGDAIWVYIGVAVAAIAILTAISLVVIGRLE